MAASRHEEFYRTFHAALWAYLLEDESAIAALQARFARHTDTWTRAWACGFYRAAHFFPGVMACAKDFYDLGAAEIVQIIVPGADTGPGCRADVQAILAGFEATLAYDDRDEALGLEQINQLAKGLAVLLIVNLPLFTAPQDRERVSESLCWDVTVDVLGDWP